MIFKEYGSTNNQTIILLHGGGLSIWNYNDEIELLKHQYHIIACILDGHHGSDKDFTTIQNNSDDIIEYIDNYYNGQVYMICGLSLGGQILIDLLSKRKDICQYALIESTLVLPMKLTYTLIKPAILLSYPLIKRKWFARLQFKSLHIQSKYFDDYYRDSKEISKENMIAFLKANANYVLKESIKDTNAKVYIIAGAKESNIMKKSAFLLHKQIPNSKLKIIQGFYHGDLSLNHPRKYIEIIQELLKKA